jgi:hypothetical protein
LGNRPECLTIEGKRVWTRESHPSWRGLHNSVKAKILLQLYSEWEHCNDKGLCLSELVKLTGTKAMSLQVLLPKWTRWHYVRRKAKIHDNKPVFSYTIAKRGFKFVEIRLPNGKREQFVAEIKLSRLTNSQREVE